MTSHARPWRRLAAVTAAVLASALALAGCSTAQTAPATTSGSATHAAVTIKDAFGETTVPASPKRVVTWGWGSTDAALAMGVVPVAIPFQSYGGDKDGVLPWIKDAVDKLGKKMPTVLPNSSDDPPYEAIAAAKPDVILAPYSGLTAKQDQLLKAIAPTVAYPDQPWATPWRDVITITGKALGIPGKATKVLDGIDAQIAAEAKAHPEFTGKTVASVWDSAGTFYVYKKEDPRVQFLTELGFTDAPSVDALSNGEQSFYYTLSYEKVDQLKSDVIVSFADDDAAQAAFLATPYGSGLDAAKTGAVAKVNGTALISAVSPPTALSLPWGMKDYVAALSTAAKAADAAK